MQPVLRTMMMKLSLLLLLVCLPLIIGRLGDEMVGRLNESAEKMPGNSSNETFYAKSTVCSRYLWLRLLTFNHCSHIYHRKYYLHVSLDRSSVSFRNQND